jgi:pimeloyl-ACP methyl ester carboxylesterase
MATFVLVHGAWEAGWLWKGLAARLEAGGHAVYRPTLTGLGERAHLASPAVDLETHVADVLAVLRMEDLTGVTLVGHSYGGMVTGAVADRAAERIGALIYLDAFIPEDGASQLELSAPARAAYFEKRAAEHDGWSMPALPASDWEVTDPAHVRLLERFSVAHPIATFRQKARLAGNHLRIAKIAYLLATGGRRASSFPAFAAKAQAAGWPVGEIESHHFPMLSKPAETAAFFVRHAA